MDDCRNGSLSRLYDGGRIAADRFRAARWDLLPKGKYMWASVQTIRGCAKHCSFCSVWRTDGQRPRQRATDPVIEEIVDLRRRGFIRARTIEDDFAIGRQLRDVCFESVERKVERARDMPRLDRPRRRRSHVDDERSDSRIHETV